MSRFEKCDVFYKLEKSLRTQEGTGPPPAEMGDLRTRFLDFPVPGGFPRQLEWCPQETCPRSPAGSQRIPAWAGPSASITAPASGTGTRFAFHRSLIDPNISNGRLWSLEASAAIFTHLRNIYLLKEAWGMKDDNFIARGILYSCRGHTSCRLLFDLTDKHRRKPRDGGTGRWHFIPDLPVQLLLVYNEIKPDPLREENTSKIILKSDFFCPTSRQAARGHNPQTPGPLAARRRPARRQLPLAIPIGHRSSLNNHQTLFPSAG